MCNWVRGKPEERWESNRHLHTPSTGSREELMGLDRGQAVYFSCLLGSTVWGWNKPESTHTQGEWNAEGGGLQLYTGSLYPCPKELRNTHTVHAATLNTSAASAALALFLHFSLPSFILLKTWELMKSQQLGGSGKSDNHPLVSLNLSWKWYQICCCASYNTMHLPNPQLELPCSRYLLCCLSSSELTVLLGLFYI